MASKSNTFSSRDTWEEISVKQPIVEWWSLIWYSMAIPMHSFILWLAVKDSLSTGDRILNGEYKGKLNAFSIETALNARTICFLSLWVFVKEYGGLLCKNAANRIFML
jgi:hypothetical protein